MKMWAVFDNDDGIKGVHHSYNYLHSMYAVKPTRIVVMREEVYNGTKQLCQWIGMTKEGVDIYNEFLKAGE